MTILETVITAFEEKFGEAPAHIVRAPGRVNLIGEHTDYNDGFVLPMAINRAMWIAFRPTNTPSVTIHSLDFDDPVDFSLNDYEKEPGTPADYVKGIAWALQQEGYELKGWEGIMKGDVPIGAGLSSSAALELSVARVFALLSNIEWNPAQMALLAQKAENKWVGVNSGIMDQMISASGDEGHALLIDCRSLESQLLPLPSGTSVVILDTNTRRELVTSAYNERRQQCEAAAKHFGVDKLRDVSIGQFESKKDGLDDVTMRRARHVITENYRVQLAKQAMLNDDAAELGKLLDASHESMRDDFEITNDALNIIVEIAQAHPASYGARMTGGGFGGCALALVKADEVTAFTEAVAKEYAEKTPQTASIYVTGPTAGAEIIK